MKAGISALIDVQEVTGYRVITHVLRPSAATPEPGWMSQCRAPLCPGHWRTGLPDRAAALAAYAGHRCRP